MHFVETDPLQNRSYKQLVSTINRINQLGAQRKSPFHLVPDAALNFGTRKSEPAFGDTVAIKVTIFDTTGNPVGEYDLGNGIYDIGEPMKETSVQTNLID